MRVIRDESGSALVEFAGFLSMLVFLFVGVVDYALFLQQELATQEAATAGAAYGAISGNAGNLTGIQAAATSAAQGVHGFSVTASDLWTCSAGGPSVSSSSTCSGGVPPYEYVVVTTSATVPAALAYPGIPANTVTHGSAQFQVQ